MKMTSIKLNEFKETLIEGMVENFKRDGFLTPLLFFYKDGEPIIGEIPFELLESPDGKNLLAGIIRTICQEPNVLAAGIIMEANGAKIENDTEMAKLVKNGNVKISELKESQDIIVLMFSTPEDEALIAYTVDCKNKTVNELFGGEEMKKIGGIFSNFFTWNKN